MMEVTATKVKGGDLKAGDLFSMANQEYWDNQKTSKSLGEKVYIRTEQECSLDNKEVEVFKITITT